MYDLIHVGCFQLRSNGFHDLLIIVLENYKNFTEICLFFSFFVYLLRILTNESSHTTLLAFEGSSEQFLRGKILFYVFGSVCCLDLLFFL